MKALQQPTGDPWLKSRKRRRLELTTIATCSPIIGMVALPAALAVRHTQGSGPTIHEVERSLYPGHSFMARKLGDPENAAKLLTICRKAMIDELPQLRNILEGTMSLWGPRGDTVEHIASLFLAVYEADYELGCKWEETRALQKPGVVSTYAVHSHANNLEAQTEAERFSADELLARNAIVRARMDTYDRQVASPGHDIRLLNQAYEMALTNYGHYLSQFTN